MQPDFAIFIVADIHWDVWVIMTIAYAMFSNWLFSLAILQNVEDSDSKLTDND
jgi:hypothetical protein